MPRISIGFGIGLILLGVILYLATGMASVTALIPSVPGLPILICGIIGLKQSLLKHSMHIAAVFGLLGFLAPLGKLSKGLATGSLELKSSTVGMILMLLTCAVYLGLCVKSFIDARRARKAKVNS